MGKGKGSPTWVSRSGACPSSPPILPPRFPSLLVLREQRWGERTQPKAAIANVQLLVFRAANGGTLDARQLCCRQPCLACGVFKSRFEVRALDSSCLSSVCSYSLERADGRYTTHTVVSQLLTGDWAWDTTHSAPCSAAQATATELARPLRLSLRPVAGPTWNQHWLLRRSGAESRTQCHRGVQFTVCSQADPARNILHT
mmetsp:Transcript_43131/g.129511  ORF Transcript_43131/g.129511 Transcript_43131/m.129511 type:complete len:200 (-) Transcript_43131:247-846(-)|eukprot:365052-Chlamydomonas_euryale.AAC.13